MRGRQGHEVSRRPLEWKKGVGVPAGPGRPRPTHLLAPKRGRACRSEKKRTLMIHAYLEVPPGRSSGFQSVPSEPSSPSPALSSWCLRQE